MRIPAVLTTILMISASAMAEVNYSLTYQGRSYPTANNLVGTISYDGMLWGKFSKEDPSYGYFRIGEKAGGAPSYAAYLQVAPIAPIVFEIQRSYTHRFTKISILDCDAVKCDGRVTRTDYSIRAAAALKNFIFLGNATWREIETPEANTAVGLEFELFTVSPGTHQYFETVLLAGYQLPENHIVGLLAINGELKNQNRKSSSAYVVYRFPWREYAVSTGAGNYTSNENDKSDFSAILSVSRNWGESLSLF